MNKRLSLLLIILILSLSTVSVSAAPASGASWFNDNPVFNAMGDFVKAIFSLDTHADKVIYLRIILTFLLFALLYGISTKVLNGFPQGSRVAICLALSLLTTTAMPEKFITYIQTTYYAAFFVLMVGGLIGGVAYLNFFIFKGRSSVNYAFKFFISLFAFFALVYLGSSPTTIAGAGAAGSDAEFWNNTIATLGNFGAIFFFVHACWCVIRFIFPWWKPATEPTALHQVRDLVRQAGNIGGPIVPDLSRLTQELSDMLDDLNTAITGTNAAGATATLGRARTVSTLSTQVAADLATYAGRSSTGPAAFMAHVASFRREVRGFETEIANVRAAVTATPPNWVNAGTARGAARTNADNMLNEISSALALVPP